METNEDIETTTGEIQESDVDTVASAVKKAASAKKAATAVKGINTVKTFTKEQLLKSKAYANKKDLINAILEPNIKYTKAQVDKAIESYFQKEVK